MNVFTGHYITGGDADDLIIFFDQVSFGNVFGGNFVSGSDVSIGNDLLPNSGVGMFAVRRLPSGWLRFLELTARLFHLAVFHFSLFPFACCVRDRRAAAPALPG